MAQTGTNIDPRYLTYTKDEVQQILDDRMESEAVNDPTSLIDD